MVAGLLPLIDGNVCVFGLQWGDEGKGKIVDILAEQAQVIVRYCGGANAGHSVRVGDKKFATHLLPVGILRDGVLNLIGNGVVIDPVALFSEIDAFTAAGIKVSPDNLRISYKAHLVMPYHAQEDAARESSGKSGVIGTTRRGIGPSYADKMQRWTALRVADHADEKSLGEKIERIVTERNKVLAALFDAPLLDWKAIFEQYRALGRRLAPFVDDVGGQVIRQAAQGKRIVFEGAHAAMLDVDHGTYPFVTSSSCSSLGLFSGAGVPPRIVRNYLGVIKAYSTRVGAGPMPTELINEIGDGIRQRGNEFGSTTRRPRRIGWFDAVAVRYATELCGTTAIALTLLDVLSGIDELRICTAYTHRGRPLESFRADGDLLSQVECVYESMPGWKQDISKCRNFDDLPAEAIAYVKRLESLAGIPIRIVSIGPEREATLLR